MEMDSLQVVVSETFVQGVYDGILTLYPLVVGCVMIVTVIAIFRHAISRS